MLVLTDRDFAIGADGNGRTSPYFSVRADESSHNSEGTGQRGEVPGAARQDHYSRVAVRRKAPFILEASVVREKDTIVSVRCGENFFVSPPH